MSVSRQCCRVFAMALASRAVLLSTGFLSDFLLPDYDTSAQLQPQACNIQGSEHPLAGVSRIVQSSAVWDSMYFDRIARCGYEFEHFLAFFPAWPWALRLLSAGLGPPWTQLAGLALTSLCFALSTALLYRCAMCKPCYWEAARQCAVALLHVDWLRTPLHKIAHLVCAPRALPCRTVNRATPGCRLGCTVTRSPELAATAAGLACISPASVFLTYSYTEALFQLLTFAGACLLAELPEAPLLAAVPFAASCAVRSNGALLQPSQMLVALFIASHMANCDRNEHATQAAKLCRTRQWRFPPLSCRRLGVWSTAAPSARRGRRVARRAERRRPRRHGTRDLGRL
jgi:Mannosyltransferase (PIG-V)